MTLANPFQEKILVKQALRYEEPRVFFLKLFTTRIISKMSSNPQRIQQHLENRGVSSETLEFDPATGKLKLTAESLVFDPATGQLMVKPQHEAQNSDRFVMLDMNKSGSGGFFFFFFLSQVATEK